MCAHVCVCACVCTRACTRVVAVNWTEAGSSWDGGRQVGSRLPVTQVSPVCHMFILEHQFSALWFGCCAWLSPGHGSQGLKCRLLHQNEAVKEQEK